jgi:lysophospholipase L1-like esterase
MGGTTASGGAGGIGGTTATGGAGGIGGTTATGGAAGMDGAAATGGAGGTVVYAPCPTNGSPCKILPFGDSITEGVKSSDGAGYRSQLFKLIVAAKQKVTFTGSLTNGPTQVSGQTFPRMHEGHAGWTIDPGYSEFSGYGGISSLVPSPALNGGPHIVLLHIGANDLFPTKDGAGMATRLDALVEKLAQNAPSALIVLAQITPVGSTNNGHTQAEVAAANAAQMTYNSKIPAIVQSHAAKGQHVIGVDMSKMPLTDLTTASVHPNDQGYAYMAGIWYAALKDVLPK